MTFLRWRLFSVHLWSFRLPSLWSCWNHLEMRSTAGRSLGISPPKHGWIIITHGGILLESTILNGRGRLDNRCRNLCFLCVISWEFPQTLWEPGYCLIFVNAVVIGQVCGEPLWWVMVHVGLDQSGSNNPRFPVPNTELASTSTKEGLPLPFVRNEIF